MSKVSLEDQIAAVVREIGVRRGVYKNRVARAMMEQSEADREIAAMEAVLQTLKWVERHRERFVAVLTADKAS